MYAYLSGRLATKTATHVYLDVNGVGYMINITLQTFSQIEKADSALLYTHLHVTEDALTLWGFSTEEEKNLFLLLVSVSGVGPNTARIVLSSMSIRELKNAILMDNDGAFKKVRGIGPKTAKRIILDLKDKVYGLDPVDTSPTSPGYTNIDEATNALIALGFQKARIQKVLEDLKPTSDQTIETLIKSALSRLTG